MDTGNQAGFQYNAIIGIVNVDHCYKHYNWFYINESQVKTIYLILLSFRDGHNRMVASYCLNLAIDVDLNRKKFVDVIMNLKQPVK